MMAPGELDSNVTLTTHNASVAGPACGATPVNSQSLFGNGQTQDESATTRDLKRKTTDPKLQTITIDNMYDLTIIVGTPDHLHGQKAFRINKGCFRNASEVWTKMLSGNWAESNMSEIRFPDDSCHAFQVVLEIAHLRQSYIPKSLTQQELLQLAILTDKYSLENTVRVGLEMKKWLNPYKGKNMLWPASTDLQDFAFITMAFKLEADFDQLVSRLAMKVMVDSKDTDFYYVINSNKVRLRSSLSTRIVSEWQKCRLLERTHD